MPEPLCAQCGNPILSRQTSQKYCGDECRWSAHDERRNQRAATLAAAADKQCCRCGEVKPKSEFHADKRRIDGVFPYCKGCRRLYSRTTAREPSEVKDLAQAKRDRERDRRAAMSAAERSARARRSRLWSFYRLTVDDYQALLREQGGVCAICRRTESRGSSKYGNDAWLAVDHDHACCPGERSCGECVRGLLCMACNTAIGAFGDSPDLLAAALDYLGNKSYREAIA